MNPAIMLNTYMSHACECLYTHYAIFISCTELIHCTYSSVIVIVNRNLIVVVGIPLFSPLPPVYNIAFLDIMSSLHPTSNHTRSSHSSNINSHTTSFQKTTANILLRRERSTSPNMPSVKSVLAALAVAFFSSANAHMILLTPPPYGSPNSSPLDPSGSNFPCKATSNSGGTITNMAIGSKQQLSFKGSAVHGGGSCQVALTTDNPATKNSKWMVIHSIEGGCPARGQGGNEGDNANQVDPDKYDYTIPQGISPGKYTLAWTWFNKIGNREMYMNCASIQVTGGSSKRDTALDKTAEYSIPELSERVTPNFPSLFVANVPPTDCTTTDSADLQFPDPGQSVEKAGTGQLAPPKGPKCGAADTSASASSGSSGGSSGAGSGAAPSAAAGGAGSSGVSVSSGLAPSGAAGGSSSGAASSGVSGASTGSCSQPGQSICSPDGKQIGTCTQQNNVTWIPVAAGTKCSGGQMVMANSKRSMSFPTDYKFGQ